MMDRRQFLASLAAAPALAQTRRPNIVFILADDLGIGDVACYGGKVIRTPNIDRLAGEGTRFTNAYAGGTVCAPSRSCLMTGQHTGHTRIRNNHSIRTGERVPLLAQDVTVAQVLKFGRLRHGHVRQMGSRGGRHHRHPQQEGVRRLVRLPQPGSRRGILHGLSLAQREEGNSPRAT